MNAYIFIVVGTINITSVELRKQSGWYGDQPEGRKRLNRSIARDMLIQKAGYAKGEIDINGPGIYIMVHRTTSQTYAYVGQAKNIGNRLLQHICDATSSRNKVDNSKKLDDLKFDEFLGRIMNIDEWELQIMPCAQKHLNNLECRWHNELEGDNSYEVINKRNPPRT